MYLEKKFNNKNCQKDIVCYDEEHRNRFAEYCCLHGDGNSIQDDSTKND